MAETLIKQGSWLLLPVNTEGELVRITAEHYKITKIEVFFKKFSDTAFPTTATITKIPSDYGLTTYFTTNMVFEFPANILFQNVRINWYGDTSDGFKNYVRFVQVAVGLSRRR